MSIKEPRIIGCPNCGTELKTIIWSSLNVLLDREAKNDLLAGRINCIQCTNCDFEAFIPVPFLYHDQENKFCVQYFPFEDIDEKDFFDNFLSNGKLNIYSKNILLKHLTPDYMKDAHIVFSMEELIRYVIFKDKLKDFKK